MNREQLIDILRMNRSLLDRFHVKSISIFGSAARDETGPDSDIDILAEFDPDATIGLFEFVELKNSLSRLLGTEVDLATLDALHPELRSDILREALHVA